MGPNCYGYPRISLNCVVRLSSYQEIMFLFLCTPQRTVRMTALHPNLIILPTKCLPHLKGLIKAKYDPFINSITYWNGSQTFLTPTVKSSTGNTANLIAWLEPLWSLLSKFTAGCDLPAARAPCGWGCSHAGPAVGGYTQPAEQKGKMPVGTEGLALGSSKVAWVPRPNTSAAVEAG